jgi:hypothetical protein
MVDGLLLTVRVVANAETQIRRISDPIPIEDIVFISLIVQI